MKQATFLFIAWILAGAAPFAVAAPDPAQPVPPVELVLGRVWRNMELQSFALLGNIRGPKNKLHPVRLLTRNREMVYEFQETPLQVRILFKPGLTEASSRQNASAPWTKITSDKLAARVLETDITYEDLCLQFLNWPDITPVGGDSIKTLKSFAFDARPAPGQSQYHRVRFWITAEHFLVVRADAYNAQDQAVKRVEVNGVIQIDDAWTVKEMQVSTLIPGRDLSSSRSFLEIREGKAEKP